MILHELAFTMCHKLEQILLNMGAQLFYTALQPLSLAHNTGKLQLLFELGPTSANAYDALQAQLRAHGLSKSFTVAARHLGSWHEVQRHSPYEITQRLVKADVAWCSFHRFWNDTAIPLRWRLTVFRGVILEALSAGLETLCLSPIQWLRLERALIKKMRFVLAGEAREHTHAWVRRFCGIETVASHVRIARLRLYRTILLSLIDGNDAVLSTALLGIDAQHRHPQLNDDGTCSSTANPWLCMFEQDIRMAIANGT